MATCFAVAAAGAAVGSPACTAPVTSAPPTAASIRKVEITLRFIVFISNGWISVGARQASLALSHHVFERFHHVLVAEGIVAAPRRHLPVTVQGVVLQGIQALGDARRPGGLVADLGRPQETGRVAGLAGALPDLLAGLGLTRGDGGRRR